MVVAYRDPAGDAYQHVQVFHRGETITITALQGPGVPVEAILGRASTPVGLTATPE